MHEFKAVLELLNSPRQWSRSAESQCVDLMREFLRREALWARALNITEELPFADLVQKVAPEIELSLRQDDLIRKFAVSVAEGRCCRQLVQWWQIPMSAIDAPDLPPNPYTPLVELFKRGGSFDSEHRVFIDVSGLGWRHGINSQNVQFGDLTKPFALLDGG